MHQSGSCPVTVLMLTEVVCLLGPRYASLTRSASSKGVAAFREVALYRAGRGAVVYTIRGDGEQGDCLEDEGALQRDKVAPIDLACSSDWGDHTIYADVKVWARTTTPTTSPTVSFESRIGNLKLVGGLETLVKATDMVRKTKAERISFHQTNDDLLVTTEFMSRCSMLRSVDLSPLRGVTSIGSGFLEGCMSLGSLNLTPLHNVQRIGVGFLARCSDLTSLDFSPMTKVAHIGSSFLAGCTGLSFVDFSSFKNTLVHIDAHFMNGCCNACRIHLEFISHFTEVPIAFLNGCYDLGTVDLSPLANVTKVNERFLKSCSGLSRLDLAPLVSVTHVGAEFLMGCICLKLIDLLPLKGRISTIPSHFLSGCEKLEELDLSPLEGVTFIGEGFLEGCESLTRLNLNPLSIALQDPSQPPVVFKKCTGLVEVSLEEAIRPKVSLCHKSRGNIVFV